jgi:hypothetical protein
MVARIREGREEEHDGGGLSLASSWRRCMPLESDEQREEQPAKTKF